MSLILESQRALVGRYFPRRETEAHKVGVGSPGASAPEGTRGGAPCACSARPQSARPSPGAGATPRTCGAPVRTTHPRVRAPGSGSAPPPRRVAHPPAAPPRRRESSRGAPCGAPRLVLALGPPAPAHGVQGGASGTKCVPGAGAGPADPPASRAGPAEPAEGRGPVPPGWVTGTPPGPFPPPGPGEAAAAVGGRGPGRRGGSPRTIAPFLCPGPPPPPRTRVPAGSRDQGTDGPGSRGRAGPGRSGGPAAAVAAQ